MLKTVKLTTKQGTTWTTSVNGQLDNKELINDIKKHGLLPEWLKNESQKYIDTELNMSDFIKKDNGIILIKPPIGWAWAIQKNY